MHNFEQIFFDLMQVKELLDELCNLFKIPILQLILVIWTGYLIAKA